MDHAIEYLDLTTGTVRTGQYWSDAPLVINRRAVWVITDGRAIHIHKVSARHRDTQRALAGRTAEYITGVPARAAWSDVVIGRHDLTREA
jgi:hypothetical protein